MAFCVMPNWKFKKTMERLESTYFKFYAWNSSYIHYGYYIVLGPSCCSYNLSRKISVSYWVAIQAWTDKKKKIYIGVSPSHKTNVNNKNIEQGKCLILPHVKFNISGGRVMLYYITNKNMKRRAVSNVVYVADRVRGRSTLSISYYTRQQAARPRQLEGGGGYHLSVCRAASYHIRSIGACLQPWKIHTNFYFVQPSYHII